MELGEKYIYEVYREKSFSKAAKKHYVAQSSLSATVKKTERKLGFLIFDRSQSPIALTPKGKIYIEYLENTIENEMIMNQRIQSLSKPVKKTISVGGTSLLFRKMCPAVCAAFLQKFPDIELKIDFGEGHLYNQLLDKLDVGSIDLVISYRDFKANFDYIDLCKERYIIAARKDSPNIEPLLPYAVTRQELLSKKELKDKEIEDCSLFKNINFIDIGNNSKIRAYLNDFFENMSVSPCYIYGSRKNDIRYELMLLGIGATINTDFTVSCFEDSDDVVYFLPKLKNKYRHFGIILKKDTVIPEYIQEFINIARETIESMIWFNK